MEAKPMKILIIEDDINDCNNFINCVKNRNCCNNRFRHRWIKIC